MSKKGKIKVLAWHISRCLGFGCAIESITLDLSATTL
jgi:hypothetical protein